MSRRLNRGGGEGPLKGPGNDGPPRALEAVSVPHDMPAGRFRVPFKVTVMSPGRILGSGGQIVNVTVRTPRDLLAVTNKLVLGQLVCSPFSFVQQVAFGLAVSGFALVEPAPQAAEETQTQVGGEQREGQDRVEGKNEEADEGGNGAEGPESGDGAGA